MEKYTSSTCQKIKNKKYITSIYVIKNLFIEKNKLYLFVPKKTLIEKKMIILLIAG